MKPILDYLTKNGETMDHDIAVATGNSLASVRATLRDLSASGAVISCNVIRFVDGVKIEGISCRISGTIPQPSPGRKAKVEPVAEQF